jgi:hypothetical protein
VSPRRPVPQAAVVHRPCGPGRSPSGLALCPPARRSRRCSPSSSPSATPKGKGLIVDRREDAADDRTQRHRRDAGPQPVRALAKQVKHTRGSNTAIDLRPRSPPRGRERHPLRGEDPRRDHRARVRRRGDPAAGRFWEMLLTRLRVAGARLLATTNPGSSQHWLRMKYILDADAQDMVVFHFTMHDNPLYFEGGDPGPSYIRLDGSRVPRRASCSSTGSSAACGRTPKAPSTTAGTRPCTSSSGSGCRRCTGSSASAMDFGTQHATSVGILGLGYDRKLYLVDELRIDVADTGQRPPRPRRRKRSPCG